MLVPSRQDLLRGVAIGTAGTVGDTFLWTLVRLLGTAYGAGVCLISELSQGGSALRAMASWPAGSLPDGATFPLADCSCATVPADGEMLRSEGISAAFPNDPVLGKRAFDGYLALACASTAGDPVGVLELATTTPLRLAKDELTAMRIFASWVGEEIERRGQRAQLRAREAELEASRLRVVAAADDERRRIGRHLHDGVQQSVLALKLLVTEVRESLDGTLPDTTRELLDDAVEEAAKIGDELRGIARGLHPSGLADHGLSGALERLGRRSAVPLRVDALPDRRLPEPIELTVYFLVAESLTNAAKYAGPGPLTVSAELGPRALRVVCSDQGPGGADPDGGSGLRGLRDRVGSLGGHLTVDSPAGAGTTLSADIPLAPFRDARDPFLEFGRPGDEGDGLEKIRRVLAGEQRVAVSLAPEWDLEGGPPRIGQELALRDHTGHRHGAVVVTRVAVMPLSLIDTDIAAAVAGGPVAAEAWRADLRAYWERDREDVAILLGQPDWRLTDDAPMVVLWFEAR